MQCRKCGATMSRSHRRGIERLIFAQAFRCSNCSHRSGRSYIDAQFDKFVNCPRCGNSAPDRRSRVDKVDSILRSPIRILHWALGGQLYHCVHCRLQFYDLRKLKSSVQKVEAGGEPEKEVTQKRANTAKMAG